MRSIWSSLLLFSLAMPAVAGSGWSQRGTITEIYNHGYTIMIKMSGTNVDYTDTCSSTAYYAIDSDDTVGFNLKYSQLLMLHASGKEAQLWINGSVCSGQGDNYQTINTIKSFQ